MVKTIDLEKNKDKYLKFIEGRKNLTLATLDEEGLPFTSCAPFIQKDGKLYIYISQVAEHYRYMEKNDVVDVFLVADESAVPNTFATERARWRCLPRNIGNEGHEELFALFNEKFDAKMLNVLRDLDFSLFELTPTEGRYVVGFGMAFDVNLDGTTFKHVVVDKSNKPGA